MLIERREINVNPHSVYLDARVIASRAFYARHVASLQKGRCNEGEVAQEPAKVLVKSARQT